MDYETHSLKQSTFAKREKGSETMSTLRHTPGPWFSGCHGRDWVQIVVDDESMLPLGTTSKLVAHVNTSIGEQQCVANAHLIAAAPAMYAELVAGLVLLEASYQDMCGKYGTDSLHAQTVWERVERTRQVIAQAEGRQ